MPSQLHNYPIKIFLADLNHDGHNVKTYPYAVGCIAAYAIKEFGCKVEIDIFKSSKELIKNLLSNPPHILGFSNYIWNLYLSYDIIKKIKSIYPEMIIVMGGPNYFEDREEQTKFLKRYDLIDFYIYHEGEIPFIEMLKTLDLYKFNVTSLKEELRGLPGCHYIYKDTFIAGDEVEKIKDCDSIPSPYLTGIFDKFFKDDRLVPLMQFLRGCPFSCTFCVEGIKYYNNLGHFSIERFLKELEYTAQRLKKDLTLHLADANFGMYKEDINLCKEIAKIQKKYGWPKIIIASTAKNNQDRVIEAVKILNGALRFGISLQSTDENVLNNIKRKNFSLETSKELVHQMDKLNKVSYSELILGLPGETIETHLNSIKSVVEADISRIQMSPLLLLPGTEVESNKSRKLYELKTKFRILPRCFSHYHVKDTSIPVAEIVEMAIENNKMSFEDYLYCKQFQLSIELFYNDNYFLEIFGLLKNLKLSVFEFIKYCHELLPEYPEDLKNLYSGLVETVKNELWDSRELLEKFVSEENNLNNYAEYEYKNSLATIRAIGILSCTKSIHHIARKALVNYIENSNINIDGINDYIDELIEFSLSRKDDIINENFISIRVFHFDFEKIEQNNFTVNPFKFKLSKPVKIKFFHKKEQLEEIKYRYEQFDNKILGMRNILYHSLFVPVYYYFRSYIKL